MNKYITNKIRVLNSIKIIDTSDGKYVVKRCNDVKELDETFNYLNSKGFYNYLNYIDKFDDKLIFQYIETNNIDIDEESSNLIEIVALMHKKTAFYKTITNNNIKKFFEEQIYKLDNLEEYYNELISKYEEEEYLSPSQYYFLRNSSLIFHSLKKSRIHLENWFNHTKDKKSERVCFIHGNLGLEHFLNSGNKYLISWNKAKNDINIFDLLIFYKKSYDTVSFKDLIDLYDSIFPLLPEEKELFFSLILEPDKFTMTDIEINNVSEIYKIINYLKISNELISNYHSSNSNSESSKENEKE